MKYIKIYLYLLSLNIKSRLAYKKDLLISLFSQLINSLALFLFIEIIFMYINAIGGWTKYEIIILYGIVTINSGIFLLLFSELENIGSEYIIEGKLDTLLIRPVNPVLLIVSKNIDEKQISEIFIGIVAVIYGGKFVKLPLSAYFFIILICINGVIIYFAVFLLINSLSFWFNSRFSIMWTFMELNEYIKFPLSIYGKNIKFLLTYIVPFALVSFYPLNFILSKENSLKWLIYLSPIISVIFLLISLFVWNTGIKKYESTGN